VASQRQLATAEFINAGMETGPAMRAAGYSANYASTNAGKVRDKLRELGLIASPEDVLDTREAAFAVFRENLEGIARALTDKALGGDVGAARLIFERLLDTDADGAHETLIRVIHERVDSQGARVAPSAGNGRVRPDSVHGAGVWSALGQNLAGPNGHD